MFGATSKKALAIGSLDIGIEVYGSKEDMTDSPYQLLAREVNIIIPSVCDDFYRD